MQTIKVLSVLCLAALFGCTGQRYTPVVSKSMNSVVKITAVYITAKTDPETGKVETDTQMALGSGVLISPNGHVLTCEHVVDGKPVIIYVQLRSGVRYIATVLRRSTTRDVALLKLTGFGPSLTFAQLAPSMPYVGDEVVAIGHPFGLEWTATVGIVSGLNRDGLAINLLQTDAAINPGNSGGPLFNLNGEVIGLNESVAVGANTVGFAVSVEEIKNFLEVYKGLERVY